MGHLAPGKSAYGTPGTRKSAYGTPGTEHCHWKGGGLRDLTRVEPRAMPGPNPHICGVDALFTQEGTTTLH